MLILRDQPGVRTLGFISLVAASGHHRTKPKEVRGPKPPYRITHKVSVNHTQCFSGVPTRLQWRLRGCGVVGRCLSPLTQPCVRVNVSCSRTDHKGKTGGSRDQKGTTEEGQQRQRRVGTRKWPRYLASPISSPSCCLPANSPTLSAQPNFRLPDIFNRSQYSI
jgi:hypothetical protein